MCTMSLQQQTTLFAVLLTAIVSGAVGDWQVNEVTDSEPQCTVVANATFVGTADWETNCKAACADVDECDTVHGHDANNAIKHWCLLMKCEGNMRWKQVRTDLPRTTITYQASGSSIAVPFNDPQIIHVLVYKTAYKNVYVNKTKNITEKRYINMTSYRVGTRIEVTRYSQCDMYPVVIWGFIVFVGAAIAMYGLKNRRRTSATVTNRQESAQIYRETSEVSVA